MLCTAKETDDGPPPRKPRKERRQGTKTDLFKHHDQAQRGARKRLDKHRKKK